jgi:diaminopimelate epimerase/tRNA dimethylallyltransferase
MHDRRPLPAGETREVIALFGPTGVGKTAVALALARRLRARGEDPVAVSADALQVYAGMETLTGVASASERAELEHRLVSFLPLEKTFSSGRYAKLAHAEIDGLLAADRRPIVVGGTGLYLRAALSELDMRPPPVEGARERWREELDEKGAPALHAILAERAPAVARGLNPNDRQRVMRALELADAGELGTPGGESQLWSEEVRRPTLLVGLTMEREALYERIDARVEAMLEAGVREEVLRANAAGASETARKALGFEELLAGDVEAMKRHTRNYAKSQLSWMRKLGGVRVIDVTGRESGDVAAEIVRALKREARMEAEPSRMGPRNRLRRRMHFEKWQALGNDYVIVERDELPFEMTPGRIRKICERHFGVDADGILLLERAEDERYVARLRIYNPDGSEAELSGNGAREAILYLRRRGWTDREEFAIETAAGEIRPKITGADTCRVDMGRASLTSRDFPGGPEDGRGRLVADGREWTFQHVSIGNPQCAIRVEDLEALQALDLQAIGPAIEGHELFPNRTNVSWYTETASGEDGRVAIRARIFERGVGETLSSGTGATGAAIAYRLSDKRSQVMVRLDGGELEVDVGEELQVHLTGWARPVFAGTLSEDFIRELDETE